MRGLGRMGKVKQGWKGICMSGNAGRQVNETSWDRKGTKLGTRRGWVLSWVTHLEDEVGGHWSLSQPEPAGWASASLDSFKAEQRPLWLPLWFLALNDREGGISVSEATGDLSF